MTIRLLYAAVGAAFFLGALHQDAAAQESAEADKAAFDLLRAGGNVLVMRHANSPAGQTAPVGMSEGCTLAEGRGLDAKGFFQARALGELLAEEEVPILKAYTSRMCRAWDTARLVAGAAPVLPDDSQMTTDAAAVAAFKERIEAELAANPGTNIILSSHSNIAPLYGAEAAEGEDEIASGAIFVVRPPKWSSVARIELDVEVGPRRRAVE